MRGGVHSTPRELRRRSNARIPAKTEEFFGQFDPSGALYISEQRASAPRVAGLVLRFSPRVAVVFEAMV